MSSINPICPNCQRLFYNPSIIVDLNLAASYRFIPLKYSLEDSFPLLLNLTLSAQQGCLSCEFLISVIRNHCNSDPILKSLWEEEAERLRADPHLTSKKLRLVLSQFFYLNPRFMRDPAIVGPWYIAGELCLDGTITSAMRIDVHYDDRGEYARLQVSAIH